MSLSFSENLAINKGIQEKIVEIIDIDSLRKPLNQVFSILLDNNRIGYVKISNPNINHRAFPAWLFSNSYKIGEVCFLSKNSIQKLEQFSQLPEQVIIFISFEDSSKVLEKIISANDTFNVNEFDSDGYKK